MDDVASLNSSPWGHGYLELDADFRFASIDPWVASMFEARPDDLLGHDAEPVLARFSGDIAPLQAAIDGSGTGHVTCDLRLSTPAETENIPTRVTVTVERSGRRFNGLCMEVRLRATPATQAGSLQQVLLPAPPAETPASRRVAALNPPPSGWIHEVPDTTQPNDANSGIVRAIQRSGSRFDFLAMGAFRVVGDHLQRVALWTDPQSETEISNTHEPSFLTASTFESVLESRSTGPREVTGLDDETIRQMLGLTPGQVEHLTLLATRLELPRGGILFGARIATERQPSLNFQRSLRDLSWLVTQLIARREAEDALTMQLRQQDTLRTIATRFLSTAPREKAQTLRESLWRFGTSIGAQRLTVWQHEPKERTLSLQAQYVSSDWPIVSDAIPEDAFDRFLQVDEPAVSGAPVPDAGVEPVTLLGAEVDDLRILTTRGELALASNDRLIIVPLGDERQTLGYMVAVLESSSIRSDAQTSGLTSLGSLLASFLVRVENEERFDRAFSDGPIPVTWRRPTGELIRCNNAFLNFIGRDSEYALLGTKLDAVLDTSRISAKALMTHLESASPAELPFPRSDGTVGWGRVVNFQVRHGGETIILSHIADTTAAHEIHQQLQHQATHDELTGLNNRRGLLEKLDALTATSFTSESVAVLLIDVDRFKVVNDSLGHAAGDELLLDLARKLENCLGPDHVVSRLGGDEFVAVLTGPVSEERAKEVAEELLDQLSGSVQLGEHEVFTSISIGIAFPHPADKDVSDLLRHADAAMYEAKKHGRNRFWMFDQRTRSALASRNSAEMEMRRAIENEELVPWFQPEFDLISGKIIGVEALVRWPHPTRGVVSADEIVPFAEETGLIADLATSVLHQACAAASGWVANLGEDSPFGLRVNMSASQLGDFDVIDSVVGALMRSGLPASKLCLEVTETALMRDPKQALRILNILVREVGVSIAVDDFGTGFSSLTYLKRLPVKTLKIDREFVADLPTNGENIAIIRTVVALARSLRLEVVAEGIEDAATVRRLTSLSVSRGQGFHLARPMPQNAIDELLFDPSIDLTTSGVARPRSGVHLPQRGTATPAP